MVKVLGAAARMANVSVEGKLRHHAGFAAVAPREPSTTAPLATRIDIPGLP
jgi:hypothetical protein